MKVDNISNTSFTGIPISKVKVKDFTSNYKLYDVNKNDRDFLNRMYKSVDLEKLYPGLWEDQYFTWRGLLESAVQRAGYNDRKVFIETCDNVPCGILSYTEKPKKFHLGFIVTFPDKPKHRVPCAGQVLFNELFGRFLKNEEAQFIDLQALRDSPFSPISKYLKLGFKMHGGDEWAESMSIGRADAQKTFEEQKKFISAKHLENQQEIDLNKTIDLIV